MGKAAIGVRFRDILLCGLDVGERPEAEPKSEHWSLSGRAWRVDYGAWQLIQVPDRQTDRPGLRRPGIRGRIRPNQLTAKVANYRESLVAASGTDPGVCTSAARTTEAASSPPRMPRTLRLPSLAVAPPAQQSTLARTRSARPLPFVMSNRPCISEPGASERQKARPWTPKGAGADVSDGARSVDGKRPCVAPSHGGTQQPRAGRGGADRSAGLVWLCRLGGQIALAADQLVAQHFPSPWVSGTPGQARLSSGR